MGRYNTCLFSANFHSCLVACSWKLIKCMLKTLFRGCKDPTAIPLLTRLLQSMQFIYSMTRNGVSKDSCWSPTTCGLNQPTQTKTSEILWIVEIDWYIGLVANIWVSPIYQYWLKRLILLASVGVDKMLLCSSCMQATCARKHNKASQDSYLATMPAGAFS